MTEKSFVVWGDSHAAHLMPGLKSVFGNSLNITQRTASLCPPIIGLQKMTGRIAKTSMIW